MTKMGPEEAEKILFQLEVAHGGYKNLVQDYFSGRLSEQEDLDFRKAFQNAKIREHIPYVHVSSY